MKKIEEKCNFCGKAFLFYKSDRKSNREGYYCSRKCWASSRTGDKSPQWKGGISNFDGYRQVYVGRRKRKFEHRIIMEKYLGRKLKKNEIVHHKNHNRADNRIENLVVMTRGKHNKVHAGNAKRSKHYGVL